MVTSSRASYHAIITDFGSARLLNDPSDNGSNKAIGQEVERNPSTEKDCSPIHLAATGSLLTLTGPAWSLRWAPPEAVSGSRPSLPSDIWAAGWVCWEIMTDQLPFPELNSPDVIATMVVEGNVPSAREDAQLSQIVALSSLMKDCWAFNPMDRPNTSKCYREVKWMPSTPPLGGASGSKASSIDLLLEMGHIRYNQGDCEGAASLFTQGLAAARSAGDPRAIAQALDWLATTYRLQCKYKEAKELLVQSQEIYIRINDDLGHAKTLYGLGNVDYVQRKFTEAQDYFTRARDIFTRIDDEGGQAAALVGLGHVYHAQSKHPEAEKSYTQASDISLRIGCNQTRGNSLRGLGQVYYKTSKYTKAEEFYAQAEDIYFRIGDRLGQANTLSGLGDVYYMQSKYSDARQSFTRAHDIYAQINNLPGQANALKRMGLTYRTQSKYKEAEESYSRAQEIFSRIGDMQGQANILRARDDIHQKQSRDVEVAAYYSKARDIYDKAWSLFR
ncbi:hypothetical protein M407DRAFT_30478 [Tulasnella calospora MUT 4182]|uniref:Protein kinase domain-containing protein n=1 Tax=Tulasnella calospora MUT 4182 TaxID=1051891 RepID=A0A0C3Q859_9AGAM|nr:hypothetical protein M407DRAFT_30478 [Tulasnella calospora MUT 4182]